MVFRWASNATVGRWRSIRDQRRAAQPRQGFFHASVAIFAETAPGGAQIPGSHGRASARRGGVHCGQGGHDAPSARPDRGGRRRHRVPGRDGPDQGHPSGAGPAGPDPAATCRRPCRVFRTDRVPDRVTDPGPAQPRPDGHASSGCGQRSGRRGHGAARPAGSHRRPPDHHAARWLAEVEPRPLPQARSVRAGRLVDRHVQHRAREHVPVPLGQRLLHGQRLPAHGRGTGPRPVGLLGAGSQPDAVLLELGHRADRDQASPDGDRRDPSMGSPDPDPEHPRSHHLRRRSSSSCGNRRTAPSAPASGPARSTRSGSSISTASRSSSMPRGRCWPRRASRRSFRPSSIRSPSDPEGALGGRQAGASYGVVSWK